MPGILLRIIGGRYSELWDGEGCVCMEMRGQRDGMFAARKQLRECVGNVEEGSLVKNEGAEAYLKPL